MDESSSFMANSVRSVQSLDRLGRRGNMRDDSAEILFQTFLQEALVSSSGMGRDVHSLMLSIQHFSADDSVAHPPRCPEGWFFERLSWRVTCPNHASFRLLTVARKDSGGLTRKLILLRTQSVDCVLPVGDTEKFPHALGFKILDPFVRISKQGPSVCAGASHCLLQSLLSYYAQADLFTRELLMQLLSCLFMYSHVDSQYSAPCAKVTYDDYVLPSSKCL